jgi:hypothetical protein
MGTVENHRSPIMKNEEMRECLVIYEEDSNSDLFKNFRY